MSGNDDLPEIPAEQIRQRVLDAGRATVRRRHRLVAGGAAALTLALAIAAIAVTSDDKQPETVVAGPSKPTKAGDSQFEPAPDSGVAPGPGATPDEAATTTAPVPAERRSSPQAGGASATSTTLGPRQGEGVGTCPAAKSGHNRILFHRSTQSPPIWHLYSVNPDGTCLQQLTFGDKHVLNWGGSWSPDRRRIAFIRKDEGVMIMNADGSGERLLLAETKVQPSGAWTEWSPDGTKIVAARQEGIWVIEVVSGEAVHLGTSQNAVSPSWSPDGSRIVYSDFVDDRDEGPGYDLLVVRPDGTDRTRIGAGWGPNWGSDGRIVFNTGDDWVAVINADGSDVRKIVNDSTLGRAVWSPDGKQIVASRGSGDMAVMNDDGSDRRSLTSGHADTASDW